MIDTVTLIKHQLITQKISSKLITYIITDSPEELLKSEQFEELIYKDNKEIKNITKIYTFKNGKKIIKRQTIEEYI